MSAAAPVMPAPNTSAPAAAPAPASAAAAAAPAAPVAAAAAPAGAPPKTVVDTDSKTGTISVTMHAGKLPAAFESVEDVLRVYRKELDELRSKLTLKAEADAMDDIVLYRFLKGHKFEMQTAVDVLNASLVSVFLSIVLHTPSQSVPALRMRRSGGTRTISPLCVRSRNT
jgi:hypothetical protein